MFGSFILNIVAWASGLTPAQLDLIERIGLPNVRKLIAVVNKLQPLIEQAEPLINEAEPLVNEALKEIKALTPVINIVLAVVERDLNAGKSVRDAFNGIANKLTHL